MRGRAANALVRLVVRHSQGKVGSGVAADAVGHGSQFQKMAPLFAGVCSRVPGTCSSRRPSLAPSGSAIQGESSHLPALQVALGLTRDDDMLPRVCEHASLTCVRALAASRHGVLQVLHFNMNISRRCVLPSPSYAHLLPSATHCRIRYRRLSTVPLHISLPSSLASPRSRLYIKHSPLTSIATILRHPDHFSTQATTNMRIPYAPNTPADPTPENEAIYQRIAARRDPRPLIPLDLALLHNPSIADGYNSLVGAIRTKSSLSQAIMELSICYIAVLTNAVYEWKAHAVLALKAGVSSEKLEKVLAKDRNWEGFDDLEKAVLEYTEESTVKVAVSDEVFEKARRLFGEDQKVMELQITIGAYNMVSRFLVGLDVTENNGGKMEVPVLEK